MLDLSLGSTSKTVESDSFRLVMVELTVEAVLLPVVMELAELDRHVFWGRCFTELLGLMVLSPRNLMAYRKIVEKFSFISFLCEKVLNSKVTINVFLIYFFLHLNINNQIRQFFRYLTTPFSHFIFRCHSFG